MERPIETKRAVLDLIGASCTSCAITIEHAGKRMNGIRDIYVDRGTSTIQVEYTGGDSALEQICDVVQRIGYEARIRETETVPSE